MKFTHCYECRKKYNVKRDTLERKKFLDRARIREGQVLSNGQHVVKEKVVYFCKNNDYCYESNKSKRESRTKMTKHEELYSNESPRPESPLFEWESDNNNEDAVKIKSTIVEAVVHKEGVVAKFVWAEAVIV